MRRIWLPGNAFIVLAGAATVLRSGETDNSPSRRDRIPAAARQEIKSVEKEIDGIEAEALDQTRSAGLDRSQEITLLGKLIFYDKELSVKRNETCAFCHNAGDRVQWISQRSQPDDCRLPGSIRTRFSGRRPQSHTYANYAPVLHYNPQQGDFVGGQLWDMRATGLRLNSALAEQAQGPPLDPTEIGLIDPACMVYRMSLRPYRSMAERLWANQAFAVHWPVHAETVCDRPSPAPHAASSRAIDRGDCTNHLRSNRRSDRDFRKFAGGQSFLLEVRLRYGREC